MPKTESFITHKGFRKWLRMGTNGIMKYIVGAKWKGMGKSNFRKLSRKYKRDISLWRNLIFLPMLYAFYIFIFADSRALSLDVNWSGGQKTNM